MYLQTCIYVHVCTCVNNLSPAMLAYALLARAHSWRPGSPQARVGMLRPRARRPSPWRRCKPRRPSSASWRRSRRRLRVQARKRGWGSSSRRGHRALRATCLRGQQLPCSFRRTRSILRRWRHRTRRRCVRLRLYLLARYLRALDMCSQVPCLLPGGNVACVPSHHHVKPHAMLTTCSPPPVCLSVPYFFFYTLLSYKKNGIQSNQLNASLTVPDRPGLLVSQLTCPNKCTHPHMLTQSCRQCWRSRRRPKLPLPPWAARSPPPCRPCPAHLLHLRPPLPLAAPSASRWRHLPPLPQASSHKRWSPPPRRPPLASTLPCSWRSRWRHGWPWAVPRPAPPPCPPPPCRSSRRSSSPSRPSRQSTRWWRPRWRLCQAYEWRARLGRVRGARAEGRWGCGV